MPHTSSVVLRRPILRLFLLSVAASDTPADALTCKLKPPRSDFSFEGLSASKLLGRACTWAWVLVAHQTSCHIQEADVAGLLPCQE